MERGDSSIYNLDHSKKIVDQNNIDIISNDYILDGPEDFRLVNDSDISIILWYIFGEDTLDKITGISFQIQLKESKIKLLIINIEK
jgi:hypothetical protein